MANEGSSQFVKRATINGRSIEIWGTSYPDSSEGTFDHFDLFEDGECLNLGDPIYDLPSEKDLQAFLAE